VIHRAIKNKFKHPPYPPSKEGGVSIYFPLGEGGLRGIENREMGGNARNVRKAQNIFPF